MVSMKIRISAEINAEIYNAGPALFEAIQRAVIEEATRAGSQSEHRANKAKLKTAVETVLADAIPADLDHRALWQVLCAPAGPGQSAVQGRPAKSALGF
jgi:hypothetical protein